MNANRPHHTRPAPTLRDALRRRAGAMIVDNFFRGIAHAGKLHPLSRPERHRVEVLEDVPYGGPGEPWRRLDVYRPTARAGKLPVVLYIHGGGFRILSKETHWVLALSFARRGYLVFNIDYRLAPRHPFPAAVEDSCAALVWIAAQAERYGGDISRLAFAGESAGANLVTTLALATTYRRPEPFARAAFEAGLVPRAVLPACGMLQVSDADRFGRRKPHLGAFLQDRLLEVSHAYLAGAQGDLDLADPVVLLERGAPPDRPLPPFFVPVGTRDPLLDDSRRLKAALDRLGVPCELHFYPGEIHAFHALVWRDNARRCWKETFRFLDEHLG
ncbi:MAG: alpha/beta hydrolase [Polyangiaceae bacterium]|nr:alpha/beta hydrolase [Polyangiaceae bacterium]